MCCVAQAQLLALRASSWSLKRRGDAFAHRCVSESKAEPECLLVSYRPLALRDSYEHLLDTQAGTSAAAAAPASFLTP